ncbi:MAG TPA: glycosyltransferase [Pirellulales bacterium]
MKISLSALVPVHNCQATVAPLVSHLLEHLAELTNRFELVIIDNGSTDATAEVIADLAVIYPQTSRLVLPGHSDWASVVRAGLRHSSGEIVLDRHEACQSGMSGLEGLWQAMRLGDVAVIRSPHAATLGSIPALPLEHRPPDWQMVRRCALDGWLRTRSNRDWMSFLAARGYGVQEIAARGAGRELPSAHVGLKLTAAADPRPVAIGKRPTRRPNYLDRIKAFALGE